jgi:hypothetical protein
MKAGHKVMATEPFSSPHDTRFQKARLFRPACEEDTVNLLDCRSAPSTPTMVHHPAQLGSTCVAAPFGARQECRASGGTTSVVPQWTPLRSAHGARRNSPLIILNYRTEDCADHSGPCELCDLCGENGCSSTQRECPSRQWILRKGNGTHGRRARMAPGKIRLQPLSITPRSSARPVRRHPLQHDKNVVLPEEPLQWFPSGRRPAEDSQIINRKS